MVFATQFIIAFMLCTAVPTLIGDLLIPNEAVGKQYIMGVFCTLAVSQCLFVPFIVYQQHFTPYFVIYALIIGGLCIVSVIKRHSHYPETIRKILNVEENVGKINFWMICALLLIGVQIIRVAIGQLFVYADNAFYIPVINDILETDLDYYLDYVKGIPGARETDRKYLFTTYFPYLASICKASGLHPAVLVQTLLPIVLTTSLYNLVWHYGLLLFRDKRSSWMFVFFFSVLVETLSGYDYTYANHAIAGIYFGKKIAFTILLPYIMLFVVEKSFLLEDSVSLLKKKDVFLLLMMMMGICAPSLMGTGLAPVIIFCLGVVLTIRIKSIKPLMQVGVSMIPSVFFLVMVIMYLYF